MKVFYKIWETKKSGNQDRGNLIPWIMFFFIYIYCILYIVWLKVDILFEQPQKHGCENNNDNHNQGKYHVIISQVPIQMAQTCC